MLVMAMTALTAPSSPSTSAAPQDGGNREVAQVPVKEPKKVDDEGRAFREFLEAYRLEPGQILKRVPPPRPEGIRVWWKQKRPNFGNQPHEFGAMTFRWRDPDQLENWSMTTGDGYPLRSLLRYLEVNLHAADIEGDPKLLDTVITGDWVYRVGEAEDRTVHALESIIQRTLRLRIAMTFRQVDREVVVVRGRYHYSPVAGRSRNQVEIYGKQIVPGGGGAGGGSGKFPEFLKWVSDWIERPVVGELEAPPKEEIEWYYNARSPFTEQMRREDHDEALVLKHLQEQTGLTFTLERKTIRILFIERAK